MTQKNRNIQLQAEPYTVKLHDIHIDTDYADWIADIKSRYLFCAKTIEKLKQLVSVVGEELRFEKLHQIGGELLRLKLQLSVGEKLNQMVAKELSSQTINNDLMQRQ